MATAWLTVVRKEKEAGRAELCLLLIALAAGASGLILGWEAGHGATGSRDWDRAVAYFVFGSVALLSAAGDVRMLGGGGVSGARRVVRHLWRMGFAQLIAAGAFCLGSGQ